MANPKDQITHAKKTESRGKIRIGSADYEIILCRGLCLDTEPCDGVCDPKSRRIFLNTDSSDGAMTLIHEICHALFEEFFITRHPKWCPEFEEVIVEAIAKTITSNFTLQSRSRRAR